MFWTYDKSRHCVMGYERLMAWGLDHAEIPLGAYIYKQVTVRAIEVGGECAHG